MRQSHHTRPVGPVPGRPGAGRRAALIALLVLTTSGCSTTQDRGWLAGRDDTTSMNRTVRDLWVNSWIAGLAVGVLVWGLTIFCVVKFRRRRHDTGLPPQLRYNVPLEILYTIVPLFMVGSLFFYTARDQSHIEKRYANPAVKVEVVAKRWSWDFNYTQAKVYDSGVQARTNADGIIKEDLPVLYLPVDQEAELTLHSRDVNHSFYVPAFDYKKDVIPGRTNYMSVTPTREGTYIGRCAELCGEYHSQMLFKVKVVSKQAYQDHLAALRQAGKTGSLPSTLGPDRDNPDLQEVETGSAS